MAAFLFIIKGVHSDNVCAELLQKERNKLFNQIFEQNKRA
tara:strand:- start:521693 stop:521812 length:120 start_codon:yes stop_codon:yes gene_type:complete